MALLKLNKKVSETEKKVNKHQINKVLSKESEKPFTWSIKQADQ